MDKAVKRYDRESAQRVARTRTRLRCPHGDCGEDGRQREGRSAQGQVLPGDPAGAVLRDGSTGAFAISQKPVTRGDYQRFTSATGRAAALCRERASVLRLLSPRSWQAPGFTQGNGEPVVCVSFEDAEAYALWYSRQTGHRYRLPNAEEARKAAAEVSGRDISLWLRDCGRNCQQRQAVGSSWRKSEQQRALTSAQVTTTWVSAWCANYRNARTGHAPTRSPGAWAYTIAPMRKPTLQRLFLTGLLTLLPIWLTWVVVKFVFVLLSDISRR
jgi:hypothetical protein